MCYEMAKAQFAVRRRDGFAGVALLLPIGVLLDIILYKYAHGIPDRGSRGTVRRAGAPIQSRISGVRGCKGICHYIAVMTLVREKA